MRDIQSTLAEMLRVLKPGGRMIIVDVYRDVKEEKRLSHVYAHHFNARVDQENGVSHNETLKRREIIDCIRKLNMKNYEYFDFDFDESHYESREQTESWMKVIDKDIIRMESHSDYEKFREEGEEIKSLLREICYHPATQLIVMGNK